MMERKGKKLITNLCLASSNLNSDSFALFLIKMQAAKTSKIIFGKKFFKQNWLLLNFLIHRDCFDFFKKDIFLFAEII